MWIVDIKNMKVPAYKYIILGIPLKQMLLYVYLYCKTQNKQLTCWGTNLRVGSFAAATAGDPGVLETCTVTTAPTDGAPAPDCSFTPGVPHSIRTCGVACSYVAPVPV